MTENALYNALSEYNTNITNKYSQNWGSLLNFMGKIIQKKLVNFRGRHSYVDR